MEFLAGMNLTNFIKKRNEINNPISNYTASKIMKGILSGVAYIHEKGITHRDMKPDNILIGKGANDSLSVKLIDFGLGEFKMKALNSNDLYCGTLIYMAPEMIHHKKYTKSVDIWSIGIIMHILITNGKHPYYSLGEGSEIFKKKLASLTKIEADPSLSRLA
jgi:serine/threonine protein kinase